MPDEQAEWIGLIAGNGRFPLLFAENARRLGYRVSAVALTGEADPSLEKVVDRIHWIALGQLRRLIKAFKQDGVRQAVMVGGVKKTHLFSDIRPDLRSPARRCWPLKPAGRCFWTGKRPLLRLMKLALPSLE